MFEMPSKIFFLPFPTVTETHYRLGLNKMPPWFLCAEDVKKGVGSFSVWNCPGRLVPEEHALCRLLSHPSIQHLPLAVETYTYIPGNFLKFFFYFYMHTLDAPFCLLMQVDESPFVNGKITHRIRVVPTANLTVSCTVSNDFGMDTRTINVSSRKYKEVVESSHLKASQWSAFLYVLSRLLINCVCMLTLHRPSLNLTHFAEEGSKCHLLIFCSAYKPPHYTVKAFCSVNGIYEGFFFFAWWFFPYFPPVACTLHSVHTTNMRRRCHHLRSLAYSSLRVCDSISPLSFISSSSSSLRVGMLGLIYSLFICMQ